MERIYENASKTIEQQPFIDLDSADETRPHLKAERLPQPLESLEEIKSHPTISQDWTNQATVDNNRLVALQEKRFVAQSNDTGGYEVEYQSRRGFRYIPRRAQKQSEMEFDQDERTIRKYPAPEAQLHKQQTQWHARARQEAQRPAQQALAMQGQPTQDQDLYLDYSSLEDEDYTESPNFEEPRSGVWNALPHSSYTAELHKASRSERRPPCLQQPYGQDETTSWSQPSNETYKNDYELKKGNGLGKREEDTGHRANVQSSGQDSCNYSHPAPTSRSLPPQKGIKAESLDNNILVQKLSGDLEKLKKENVYLKSRLRKPLPRLQVVYRVSRVRNRSGDSDDSDGDETVTDMYLDKPQYLEGDKGMASLQGHLPIFKLESYLERHPNISVIVFQDTSKQSESETEDRVLEVSWSESILVTSRKLMKSLKILVRRLSSSLGCRISLDFKGSTVALPAPYLPFYHYLGKLTEYAADLPPKARQEWNLLMKYVEDSYGDQYREVKEMLAAGTISQEFIPYLIKDGDTIVRRDSRGHSAYVATSQPTVAVPLTDSVPRKKHRNDGLAQYSGVSSGRQMDVKVGLHSDKSDVAVDGMSDSSVETQEWKIGTESWQFDGNFEKRHGTIILKISSRRDEMLSIKDLEIYPIHYADRDLVPNMKNAGLELWKSRTRRYISYRSGQAEIDTKSSKPRYMIDPGTYKKLHANKIGSANPLRGDLGPESMSAEEPPADPFLLLLPRTVNGFNMHNKKWEELDVARISEVSWNKEAFESLVVEPTTKTLIKALVMQQLEEEKGTDLIAGKGQGLIVLLHGGPGTGKTFTAETVAEIAEKPLYRVTCGDHLKYLRGFHRRGKLLDSFYLGF